MAPKMSREVVTPPELDETRLVSSDLFMRGVVGVEADRPIEKEEDIEALAQRRPRTWEEMAQIAAAQRLQVA